MLLWIFLILVRFMIGKIHIWNPPTLAASYRGQNIEYTIADLGDVPYGKSLIGKLVQANPFDLCSVKPGYELEMKENEQIFLMVERGGCHFAEKAKMAQKIGAAMVIIVDNDPIRKNLYIIENDLNLLKQIKIPTIFVS